MTEAHDVVVLGAGFGGLAVAHALAAIGVEDIAILERSDGVGGTWRANTYPGAACDVPSHLYSLSFAPNPAWSRTYATQPEILRYIEDCYDRFDVRRKVRCGVDVVAARWDDERARWTVTSAGGGTVEAGVLVSAVGLFQTPSAPAIAGLDRFAGRCFHSARWDHGHALDGRRVAVVGTGASAIQIVPAIAGTAAHVDVYQRTPPWILPRKDAPYTDDELRAFAEDPALVQEHRRLQHDAFEQNRSFVVGDASAAMLEAMAREYLARKVPDPVLRAKLTPSYPIGCKRTLISSDFYPALQRDDVELVTDAIAEVEPDGIRTADGSLRPCDTIVLCTGFRATDYLHGIEVVGRHGEELHETWAGTARAYHGMAVPGFPSFFMLYGPNTNQGGNSIILVLEAQAGFVAGAMATMREVGASHVDLRPEAMARYLDDLHEALARTVWATGCDSYFRTPEGAIVTQLPYTAGWYAQQVARFPVEDFELGPAVSRAMRTTTN